MISSKRMHSLTVTTIPSYETDPSAEHWQMPPMAEFYRRIVRAGRTALNAHARYTGNAQALSEYMPLPAVMHPRLGRFMMRYLAGYEPFIDPPPSGDDTYLCHTFTHELMVGEPVFPRDALLQAQELADHGTRLAKPEAQLQPGDMGIITDLDEGYALGSFISLGGDDTLQVIDTNSHIARATLHQILRRYSSLDINAGVMLADPARLG